MSVYFLQQCCYIYKEVLQAVVKNISILRKLNEHLFCKKAVLGIRIPLILTQIRIGFYFSADLDRDQTFPFDADPDSAFFHADLDPQQNDGSLVNLHGSIVSHHGFRLSLHGSRLSFHCYTVSLHSSRLFTLMRNRNHLPKMMRIRIRSTGKKANLKETEVDFLGVLHKSFRQSA
jgi:hypothetical protein